MERSAVNSYTTAGAFIGVLFGLWASNIIVGTDSPEYFFSLTALLAMPITAFAYWMISRRYQRAKHRERLFYAISGWIVLVVSAGIMIAGVAVVFPKATAA